MAETIVRGRLNGAQRSRLGSLLNMLYRPSELADVVGFNRKQVYRVYVPLGCPHQRDEMNHIWINGAEFCDWYEATYTRSTLEDGQAYCLTCKRPVTVVNPEIHKSGFIVYSLSDCPHCGRRLSRIIRQER